MKRWLPRTLFGRMVGILLIGLILAQTLNRAIHLYEHHKMATQASQTHAARRVAQLIRLLTTLKPETRRLLVDEFNDPSLRIIATDKLKGRRDTANDSKFQLFLLTLHTLLGNQQPTRITVTETTPEFLSLQVNLSDGNTLLLQTNLTHDNVEGSSILLHLAIILIAITSFSYVAVLWVTRPLQQLANAAEDLGKNIHRPPLDESGPIEVSRAAHAFNAMQARLIRHIQDRTQLLAAISHDLKTPITRLRLRTELLDDNDTRMRFQKDLDDMESMVVMTLDFMRGVGEQEAFQQIDMMAMLESIQADAQEMNFDVTINGTVLIPYRGKPTALKRCINNLVDNALKYGHSAALSVEDNADFCVISIVDQGTGLPNDQLKTVFRPYYRLESSRNRDSGGTGLGLSISQDIAEVHGGSLVLHNTASGGLAAVLSLPRNYI